MSYNFIKDQVGIQNTTTLKGKLFRFLIDFFMKKWTLKKSHQKVQRQENSNVVQTCANLTFADQTFADKINILQDLDICWLRRLPILAIPAICWLSKDICWSRHLLILSNNGDLLIQTYFTQDLKKSQEHAKRYHLKEQWKSKTGVKNDTPFYSRPPIEKTNSDPLFKG